MSTVDRALSLMLEAQAVGFCWCGKDLGHVGWLTCLQHECDDTGIETRGPTDADLEDLPVLIEQAVGVEVNVAPTVG